MKQEPNPDYKNAPVNILYGHSDVFYEVKDDETITMKLSDYDCIISKLDNARKEADFWKAKYEALLEETQNER